MTINVVVSPLHVFILLPYLSYTDESNNRYLTVVPWLLGVWMDDKQRTSTLQSNVQRHLGCGRSTWWRWWPFGSDETHARIYHAINIVTIVIVANIDSNIVNFIVIISISTHHHPYHCHLQHPSQFLCNQRMCIWRTGRHAVDERGISQRCQRHQGSRGR